MGILSPIENYGDKIFRELDMSELKRDEAYLNITTSSLVHLYSVYEECVECPFTRYETIEQHKLLKIDTRYSRLWRVATTASADRKDFLCDIQEEFGEFGVYDLRIFDQSCQLDVAKEPVNIYFPILFVILIYVLIGIFVYSFAYVWKIYLEKVERETTSYDKDVEESQPNKRQRLQSLDTFRGISIVLMIFVNYGCGGYASVDHAVWNGLQLADVVFPWFMWIMGVCIPISVNSIIKKGISTKKTLKNILRRSCILFLLGLILGGGVNLDKLRVFGVLQRFGICYLVTASIFVLFSKAGQLEEKGTIKLFKDIIALKYQWATAFGILIVHNLVTFLLPIPNCDSGYLGPGGYHENGRHVGCTGGAAGYIDKEILGLHRYQNPTIRTIYKSDAFDPEGILGSLTSIVQVIIGAQAGATVIFYKKHTERHIRWLIWAVVLGLLGGVLCGFSKEDGLIPINKNLWSISFVLVTSSLAFFLLAGCYYLIDVKHYWSGKPFLFAGTNATLMYVGHMIIFNNFPIRWVPVQEVGLNTHFLTMLENVWATGMWVVIAYYLYRIKFFLSI